MLERLAGLTQFALGFAQLVQILSHLVAQAIDDLFALFDFAFQPVQLVFIGFQGKLVVGQIALGFP